MAHHIDDDVDNIEICNAGDYNSEFEYDSEVEKRRKRRADLAVKPASKKSKLPQKIEVTTEYNKEEGRKDLYHILSLDAYSRHKKFINDYLLYYGGSSSDFRRDTTELQSTNQSRFPLKHNSRDKTDLDVIRENHKFLWDEDEDEDDTWGKRLAKKYYEKLFKEYCIADLSRYKENKIALRWRIESEVMSGKGQFTCGSKRCEEQENLRSWEVNFGYVEHGQKRNALVKLRLCPECSHKLNYHHRTIKSEDSVRGARSRKREIKAVKKLAREKAQDELETPSNLDTEKQGQGTNETIHMGHIGSSLPSSLRTFNQHYMNPTSTVEHLTRSPDLHLIRRDDTASIRSLKIGVPHKSGVEDDEGDKPLASSSADSSNDDSNVWTKPVNITEEKSRNDEFDDYFEDMFL